MPTLTLRANVWEEVRSHLPARFDDLDAQIQTEVENAEGWRSEVAIMLNDRELAEVNRIIEEEDLNTE